MPKLKEDGKMSKCESDNHYSINIICGKWYHSKPVLFLATKVDDTSGVSNRMRRTKGSVTKLPVSCPKTIKPYIKDIGGVVIMDKKSWLQTFTSCKSKYCFYLSIFLYLIDVALVKSHVVYKKLGSDISLLNFKIVAKALIGRYNNQGISFRMQKFHEPSMRRKVPTHMPKC